VVHVKEMFHDGFVTLRKNIMVYGHVTRTRARYFLRDLVEKVNAKKIGCPHYDSQFVLDNTKYCDSFSHK